MITLLLSFFVMMVCFSSTDKSGREKYAGVMQAVAKYSIVPLINGPSDSLVRPPEGVENQSDLGSEKPTESEPDSHAKPKSLAVSPDQEAYKDQKILRLPSARLFWGKGNALSEEGKQSLAMVAEFVQKVPCHISVAEIGAADGSGLDRAWVVQQYLIEQGKLTPETCAISPSSLSGQSVTEPTVEICLMARSVHP